MRAGSPSPAPSPSLRAVQTNDAAARWRAFLEEELDCAVVIVATRARKTPLRVRPLPRGHPRASVATRRNRGVELRMHAMFDAAPLDVQRAVASWIRSGDRAPRATRTIDAWIEAGLAQLPPPPPSTGRLRARGHRYDLEHILADVLATDLAGEAKLRARPPHVTWGSRARSRTRGGLRLGSYDPDLHRVRIHTALDQLAVPEWFVRYVVFHECLHAVFPPKRGADGRWIHHGSEFRAREAAYPDYPRVLAWEKANLRALARSARKGLPMGSTKEVASATPAATTTRVEPKRGMLPRAAHLLQALLFPEL